MASLTAGLFLISPLSPLFVVPRPWGHRYSLRVPPLGFSFPPGLPSGRIFFAAVAEVQGGDSSYPLVFPAGSLADDRAPVCCDARRLAPLSPVTNPPQALSLRGSSSLRTFFPDGSSSLLVSLLDSLELTPQLPPCLAGGRIDNGAHRLLWRQCTGSSVLWHRFSIAPLSWRRQL